MISYICASRLLTLKQLNPGVHFKKPVLNAAGYTSTADVSTLDGHYTLGLAFKEGGHIKICPQFKMPAEIKKFSLPSTAGR